jgi:hypothetical protein
MSAIAFQAWLDSEQDFTQGVQLYAQHPEARPALVSLLQRAGAGPFTTSQLVDEMERLVIVSVPFMPVAPYVPPTSPELAPELAPLVAERVALFKEASHLHGTLRLLDTDEARFKAACTIKKNFRRIDAIWDAQAYHAEHGGLPPVVETVIAENDPAAWTKRRNTLRTYLSSKRGTREKRAAWQAELAELERKLRQ